MPSSKLAVMYTQRRYCVIALSNSNTAHSLKDHVNSEFVYSRATVCNENSNAVSARKMSGNAGSVKSNVLFGGGFARLGCGRIGQSSGQNHNRAKPATAAQFLRAE